LLKDIGASCKNLYNYEDVEIDEDGIEIQVEETRVTGVRVGVRLDDKIYFLGRFSRMVFQRN